MNWCSSQTALKQKVKRWSDSNDINLFGMASADGNLPQDAYFRNYILMECVRKIQILG